jgi:hypothetical protein
MVLWVINSGLWHVKVSHRGSLRNNRRSQSAACRLERPAIDSISQINVQTGQASENMSLGLRVADLVVARKLAELDHAT